MNSKSGTAAGVATCCTSRRRSGSDLLADLLGKNSKAFVVQPDGHWMEAADSALIVAGAFNPLHSGHLELASTAAAMTGLQPSFELCVVNVDKPPLDALEVRKRIKQFAWKRPIWITRTPTFVEKAAVFPNATFVVGADTAERIVNPRYYNGQPGLTKALRQIQMAGCRFLVATRRRSLEHLLSVEDIDIPVPFQGLFQPIPTSQFLMDISSTELRIKRMNVNGQQ